MFSNSDCFTMPVVPAGYAANGNAGVNGAYGDWLWIIVVLAMLFGWGNNGLGNGFGNNGFAGSQFIPYQVGNSYTDAAIQRGFDNQAVINKLDGITNGICDSTYAVTNAVNTLGTNVMQGFSQAELSRCNQQAALMQQLNNMAYQQQDCCCQTQRAIDAVNYNMATNTCAIQNTANNNTRDIIDSQNSGTRAIIDKLCQMEYNSLNDKYQSALAENQTLKFQASQAAQNAYITANQDAQTAELIRRLGADCPVNAVVVQPNTPVTFPTNCCGGVNYAGYGNGYNNGCGCGNNSGCC